MMFEQTVSLVRDYPRSIGIISALQFGIQFVCIGMLLFFPDILNQTANFMRSSDVMKIELCAIVENAIEARKNKYNSPDKICVEELDISAYYYAIILEACYTVGFMIVTLLVNYVGRLTIFSFVFFSTGVCGFLIVFVNDPIISTYLYVWLLVSGVNNNLLNTVTYDLFPTNQRSLAMSLSLMFGRLGEFFYQKNISLDFESLWRNSKFAVRCRINFMVKVSANLISSYKEEFLRNKLKSAPT